MNTIFIVLPILTLLMFDLGLTLKPQDFKLIAQRPKPVIVGLVGQIILLPLIAWGIIALLSTFDFRLSTSLLLVCQAAILAIASWANATRLCGRRS